MLTKLENDFESVEKDFENLEKNKKENKKSQGDLFDLNNEFINGSISVFVVLLIISGNFLGELMPCRVRKELSENMWLKHFFGYLTLVFFAVLTVFKNSNINVLILSFIIYLYFLLLSKTNWRFWMAVVFLLGVAYFIYVWKTSVYDVMLEKNDIIYINSNKDLKMIADTIQNVSVILAFILTIIGVIVYLGNKKREYGKDFSYTYFYLGKPECKGKSPSFSIIEDFYYAFGKKK